MKLRSSLIIMPPRFHRHKLLLDEGLYPRKSLSRVNSRHDVKHIKHDFHQGGIKDEEIYKIAIKQKRIIVTYNTRDFKRMAENSNSSGIIGVTPGLTPDQLDTKLNSILGRNSTKTFYGKDTPLGKKQKLISFIESRI